MISLQQTQDLAKDFNVIPVIKTIFSGVESPVTIFEKVSKHNRQTFLLESAEHGVWSRYSFIGVEARGFLTKLNGQVTWESFGGFSALPDEVALPEAGLDAIESMTASWRSDNRSELPPLTSGLVGYLSWSMIHEIEELPPRKEQPYKIPDFKLAMMKDSIVIDHQTGSILLVSNVFLDGKTDIEAEYHDCVKRITRMVELLLQPSIPLLSDPPADVEPSAQANLSPEEFSSMVIAAKKHVVAGDVFQVVLSQRFQETTTADALDVYRMLRALNPSPYMYLFNFQQGESSFAIVGSSPEALVKVADERVIMHPIAGSRRRGETWDADMELEQELLADEKERSEHLMLVDLARNDLLKVCQPTSVAVSEFMQVHKFSHIQHLVSTVEGDLKPECSTVDVFRATFPAGTLSGAPKPKALEIIENLEPQDRGLFGGVVGYFDFNRNADLAIAIRTALLKDGQAYIQAGAGIVLDSVVESERFETVAKASAPMRAVLMAEQLQRLKP